jgi:hypothetical protein
MSIVADVLTLMLVLRARDQIAAQQFISKMTSLADESQVKMILFKAVALAGPGAKGWLVGIY